MILSAKLEPSKHSETRNTVSSLYQKLALMTIAARENELTSAKILAADVGENYATFQHAIAILEDKGIVTITERPKAGPNRMKTRWAVNWDAIKS